MCYLEGENVPTLIFKKCVTLRAALETDVGCAGETMTQFC